MGVALCILPIGDTHVPGPEIPPQPYDKGVVASRVAGSGICFRDRDALSCFDESSFHHVLGRLTQGFT